MRGIGLILFTLIWSGFILLFDTLVGRESLHQLASRHFPVAPGTVTRSEEKTHTGSKGGTTYTAVIEYRFKVGERTFFGERWRYVNPPSGQEETSTLVATHAVDSAVDVYYDPADPAVSLLLPGIEGRDLMLALFLTPFHAVMLGLWVGSGAWLRERLFRPVAGGVRIIRDGMATRVRLPSFPAVGWGLVATGGLGFVSMFVVGISTGMQPSLGYVTCSIGVVYLGGLAVYLWQRQKINSGIDDLVINKAANTLELPPTQGRKQRATVNRADVEHLTVETVVHTSSKGGISYTYQPTLILRQANPQKLAGWSDKVKADDFAAWLREQLGL
jgi:hypothetical protein